MLHSYSDDSWFGYDHGFKYNPDGRAGSYKETNYSAFQLNHMISPRLFYELKLSVVDNNYGNYLFKNINRGYMKFNLLQNLLNLYFLLA